MLSHPPLLSVFVELAPPLHTLAILAFSDSNFVTELDLMIPSAGKVDSGPHETGGGWF